jgi:O-antigen ligase
MVYLIILSFFLAPAYEIRFNIFGFPGNILLAWIVFVWIVFAFLLVKEKTIADFVEFIKNTNKRILLLTTIFFISSAVSLFVAGENTKKLGQFIVLFLQPISLYFISGFYFAKKPDWQILAKALYVLLGLAGLYALVQYFTLYGLPPAYWGNSEEPKRAVSFFSHPNFYALFASPLLAFLIPDLFEKLKTSFRQNIIFILLWAAGAAGLFLSLSRAGWLGLAAAACVFAAVSADRKIKLTVGSMLAAAIFLIVLVPNLRYRILLPFYGERSANSRVILWEAGWNGVKKSPIKGLGLMGFSREYRSLVPNSNLDSHNFPHNIFLDLWVETGLLGLLSFTALVSLTIYHAYKYINSALAAGVILFLLSFMIQGQIDNPYFKNDLALIFWLILSLATFYGYTDKKTA